MNDILAARCRSVGRNQLGRDDLPSNQMGGKFSMFWPEKRNLKITMWALPFPNLGGQEINRNAEKTAFRGAPVFFVRNRERKKMGFFGSQGNDEERI